MFTQTMQTRTINGKDYQLLISTPNVVELLANDPERQLLIILEGTGDQMEIYNDDDAYRMLEAHQQYLTDPGQHFGDCTRVACSCALCIIEMSYEEVVKYQQQAKDIDLRIDLATLLLATEAACDRYATLSRYHDLTGRYKGVVYQDSSIVGRLKLWDKLTEEQQQKAAQRAAQFRQWIAGPLPPMPTWANE